MEEPVERTVRKVTTKDVRHDAEKVVDTSAHAAAQAKARWTEKTADLEAKQQVARDKLGEVRKSTGEAWEHLEKGAKSAWDDVRKAFQEAAEEF